MPGPDQLDGTGRHRFRPLGHIAHDQHRLAQRRRLFLHAAGIGQHDMGVLHQADEVQVVEWCDQMDVAHPAERLQHRAAHIRIQMDRINDVDVIAQRQLGQGRADMGEAVAEVFPPVTGHQQDAATAVQERKCAVEPAPQAFVAVDAGNREAQRIDHGIAGHDHLPCRLLAEQQLLCGRRRRKQPLADQVDGTAVHFFRPWLRQVTGAQAGLDMGHRDATVERGQRRHHGGAGIAMHQDVIGVHLRQHRVQLRKQPSAQPVQGLVLDHDVQIEICLDLEQRHDLRQHLAMLPGDADPGIHTRRTRQELDQRRHLDGFRMRAEN